MSARMPGNVLAAARALAGLSQGGLASIANVTRATIVRAEKGLPVHDRNMAAIMAALRKHGIEIVITGDTEIVSRRSE